MGDKIIIYVHGKGGNANEAKHYKPFFDGCEIIGMDYTSETPWDAVREFSLFYDDNCKGAQSVEIVANSIGAFFSMYALADKKIDRAYFISPVADMEKLIYNMMSWANITEEELRLKKEIRTDFGETLSWEYLCYVKENPIRWKIPTHILYGERDNMTDYKTILEFAEKIGATLTVMQGGEHWFHTKEQMKFLDRWIRKYGI